MSGYTWNNGNAVLDGELVTGLNQRGLPITNLSWTKNTTSNIGFDLTMFNNRLKITADAFRKDITGVPAARYDVLLPSEVGYSLPNENLNKQAYIGAEGMVTWTDHIGDLNYTVSGNFTFSRYKVLRLINHVLITHGTNTAIRQKAVGEVFIGGIRLSDNSSRKKKFVIIR